MKWVWHFSSDEECVKISRLLREIDAGIGARKTDIVARRGFSGIS
jgi:hypothetical protein